MENLGMLPRFQIAVPKVGTEHSCRTERHNASERLFTSLASTAFPVSLGTLED